MPPKNTKRPKKNSGKDQGGIMQREERVRQERAQLNVEMKSFQQPSVKESLASQGMTLRGCMLRTGPGDMKEGTYMELVGPGNEDKVEKDPLSSPRGRGPIISTIPPSSKTLNRRA